MKKYKYIWLIIGLLITNIVYAEKVKEIVIYNYDYGEDDNGREEPEEIYSGKYDIAIEETERFLIIPEENGFLTINAYNAAFCTVNLYASNGKLLKKMRAWQPIQVKVKKGRKYYLHVIANNQHCKYIDVFVPGL